MAKKSTYPALLQVQVPASWQEALDRLAAKQARTRSELARDAIREVLEPKIPDRPNTLPEPLEAV